MSTGLVVTYIVLTLGDIGFILGQLYFIISAADLESDYINPMEFCQRMEFAQRVDAVAQALVSLVLLVHAEWISLLLTLLATLYNAWNYHVTRFEFDATQAFKSVGRIKRDGFAKLVYYFGMFCYFLYSMIHTLVVATEA